LIALFVGVVISCGGSGGGGSNGLSTINYSSSDQAASAFSDAAGMVALVDVMSSAASGIAASGVSQAGYAPNKGKTANTSAIANVDPRLKTIVDKMVGQMQSTAAKNAEQKARLKVSMAATVSASVNCTPSGSYSITGTDNSDNASRSFDEATVTIVFNNCRDSVDFTELSGTIQLYSKITPSAPAVPTSTITNITVTNLTHKQYIDGTFTGQPTETGVISGTFNSTNNVTSGSDYANGSFNFSNNLGDSATFFFTGLTDNWSTSTVSSVTTDSTSMNGSFGLSYVSGYDSINLSISLTNLEYKVRTNADASIDEWLNGSIGIVWNPLVCASGIITFTTADATPLHYASGAETCPDRGTLQVNNATIVYGTPILVTVNGVTVPYADCAAMDMAGNGMCI
jgi:hypothetical protein